MEHPIAPGEFIAPGLHIFPDFTSRSAALNTLSPPNTPPKAGWRAVLRCGFTTGAQQDVAANAWVDLTIDLRDDGGLRMNRGRQEDTTRFDAGSFSATVNNVLGKYDPANNPDVKPEKCVQYLLEYPWFQGPGQPGLVPNGGFDTGFLTEWPPCPGYLCSVQRDQTVFYDNAGQSCAITAAATNGAGTRSTAWAVTPGKSYAGSVRCIQDAANLTLRNFRAVLRFWSGANGTGSQVQINTFQEFNVGSLGITELDWRRIGIGPVVAPAGSQSVTVDLIVDTTAVLEVYRFDSCIINEAAFQGMEPQWTGYVDEWARNQEVEDSVCTINATDGFKILGYPTLNSKLYSDYIKSLLPTHYYRLSEKGSNNVTTRFVDSITGNNEAHSTIDAGVGPLYNVPGACITETDGAFSTLGPSSADKGHIQLPVGMAISGTQSFFIMFWYRYPKSGTSLVSPDYLFTQGVPLISPDWIEIDVQDNQILLNIQDSIGGTGLANVANVTCSAPGLQDGAPHQIAVYHDEASNDTYVFYDGQQIGFDPGQASGCVLTARTPFLGGVVNPGVVTLTATAELDEFTLWKGADAPANGTIAGSYVLAAYNLARLLYPAETSGSRINRLLDLCGWPNEDRNIDIGSSNVDKVSEPFVRANPLQEIQKVEESESGFVFMGKDNKVRFIERHALFTAEARNYMAIFGSDTANGELPIAGDPNVQNDSRLIINRTEYSMQNGGQLAVYEDDASIADYWPRTDAKSDLQLTTQEEVIAAGIWTVFLYKDQVNRVTQFKLNPLASEEVLYLSMYAEIGQRLIIFDRKPGVAGPVAYEAVLLGIQHSNRRGSLEVTWDVSSVYTKNIMCFGDDFDTYPMGW